MTATETERATQTPARARAPTTRARGAPPSFSYSAGPWGPQPLQSGHMI